MAELIVLGFKNEAIADEVVPQLEQLQREGLLELADWARVSRRQDGKIDIRQATSTTGLGAAGTSALFLYATRITTDRVVARLRDYEPTVIRTSLSEAAEEQLRSEIQVQPTA